MFKNCPTTDFSIKENFKLFEKEIDKIKKLKFSAYPIVDGKNSSENKSITIMDPNFSRTELSEIKLANDKDIDNAIQSATNSKWKEVSINQRISIIRKVADLLRKKRVELSALIVREVAKPWLEADKDIVEAIDFCNYYASCMEEIASPKLLQKLPGEDNFYLFKSRGLSLVIPPWNFPLAIPCGMLAANLLAGNSVIFKPAEQSTISGLELAKVFWEAGIPNNALQFLPGDSKIGEKLCNREEIKLITFTGSRKVGQKILENSSRLIKVIAEMGGKNPIIIDEDADLDLVIKETLYSCFSYSGQKCSACSRIIILEQIYDDFMSRFIPALDSLVVGPSYNSNTYIPPLINSQAKKRVLTFLSTLKERPFLHIESEDYASFSPIRLYTDVDVSSPLWNNELFAPIIAIKTTKDFREALTLANYSDYAMTAGVFSRSLANIKLACHKLEAGNIYINRGITGAVVARQPFGGYKFSGTGPKAGGENYLHEFLHEVSISENTSRQGVIPGLS